MLLLLLLSVNVSTILPGKTSLLFLLLLLFDNTMIRDVADHLRVGGQSLRLGVVRDGSEFALVCLELSVILDLQQEEQMKN